MADYTDYFADKKNVFFELGQARKAFNKNTTYEQFDELIKGLGLMFIYCPEDMQHMVEATMNEATIRQGYASHEETA